VEADLMHRIANTTHKRQTPWPLERAELVRKHAAALERAEQRRRADVLLSERQGFQRGRDDAALRLMDGVARDMVKHALEDLTRAGADRVALDAVKSTERYLQERANIQHRPGPSGDDTSIVFSVSMRPWQLSHAIVSPRLITREGYR
jgi:hypothetical protein